MNITNLTTAQLNQIIAIKEQIEVLQSQIDSIANGHDFPVPFAEEGPVPAKRKLSVAHRRKLIKVLARARKIRWAKMKGTASTSKPAKKKRRISAAGRAAMRAAGKARWAKARAEGKTTL